MIFIAFVVIFLVLLLIYFYKCLTHKHDYWLSRGIKGPWPLPLFGTTFHSFLDYRCKVDVKWMRKYGKIYGVFEGNQPVLRLCDPKLIKDILVKDFNIFTDRVKFPGKHIIDKKNLFVLNGDDWKRVRSVVSPIFTSGKLKKMFPLIRECLKDFMSALEMLSNDGKDVNMKIMYLQYTMDVMTTCVFATKTDLYNNPNHLFITNAIKANADNYWSIILTLILPEFVLKYFQMSIKPVGSNQATEYFYSIIRGIIESRKISKKSYNDFIELMLKLEKSEGIVRDDNDINESYHVNEGEEELNEVKKTLSGVEKYMTENEIIANAQIFLLSGTETTSTALSFCTQELALNPEVQEKLYSEIKSSVDSNGEIDYHLLTKLPYLDAVISETLRLHSPALVLGRYASEDYKLGDTGITIMKGQSVEIPIFAVHLCEEYYPNADQFIPERFLPENRHKIIPYTYLPFGAGPRNCIGLRFALLVLKLTLASLIHSFRIVRSNNTDIPVLLSKSQILHTPQRIMVKLDKRI